jgi:Fic family protein
VTVPNNRGQPHGRRVEHSDGYQAYVPAPLPPAVTFSAEVWRALSDADRLIGRLAGETRGLPNPHILMRPFVQREAVLSSRIEGTTTTLPELLAQEAGAEAERDPDDLAEVTNYIAALDLGVERLKTEHISLGLVKDLHKRLMQGVRGQAKSPGQFRTGQVFIGRPGSPIHNATYVPPPAEDLADCLAAWEKYLADRALPPLVQLALLHYQFEAIHPFRDGNGRVGRLVNTLFLLERGLLPAPLLYLSAFFEATRQEYYRRLLAVSREGDWDEWVAYVLNGVARQSEDAVSRAVRITALLDGWRRALVGARSDLPLKLVDDLAANPYCVVKVIAKREKVAYTTAERAVERLVKLKILKQVNKAERDRLFCATAVLDILEEPANLTPEGTG